MTPDASPHQEAISVIAPLDPTRVDAIKAQLGTISDPAERDLPLPFGSFFRLHFARLFVLDDVLDLDGAALPPKLVYLANVDAPVDAHLDELASADPAAFDAVFSCCEGYPAMEERSLQTRVAFLRARLAPSQVFYVNRGGRSVRQIRAEERLRRGIDEFLDAGDYSARTPGEVRSAIVDHVRATPELAWAMQPAPPIDPARRRREMWHAIGGVVLAILFAPLFIAILPVFLLLLFLHERRDKPDESRAPEEKIRSLRDDEDLGGQNQIVAAGVFKPGLFRKITTRGILLLADFAVRHVYNRGTLSGLNTIHFARWVSVDDGRAMFFSSNYDGSLESYMNDFIDKAAWGLNAIFSNGDGFPRTSFLFCGGITDEQAYKRFLPTRHVRSQVWYSAYPGLSTKNLANNAEIRAGLGASLDAEATAVWLRRFGVGNQLPESGAVARLLDRIPWSKICRYQTN